MAELTALDAQAGQVRWIGLRPKRRADMVAVQSIDLTEAGLVGDHGRAGKRAVTLYQHEHLAAIGSFLNITPPEASVLRRNIHIEGLNLSALKAVPLTIGTAVIEITTICAPCSRMHEAFGPGGYNAMRGHGGWCARVLQPGHVSVGDPLLRT